MASLRVDSGVNFFVLMSDIVQPTDPIVKFSIEIVLSDLINQILVDFGKLFAIFGNYYYTLIEKYLFSLKTSSS